MTRVHLVRLFNEVEEKKKELIEVYFYPKAHSCLVSSTPHAFYVYRTQTMA